ncbi:MAG: hypothetical protein GTN62_06965 [Gemmatimonadales bacterium]|nr:hypothetical protein [Gemmatimonadales bacterium]NIN11240.1 hypothetical protein [Gemmatimonadales bacterium]NIN49839.1 hypothetical protein [Gemmatimonadales bacterium]NIP07303.1 hypothetical protein [Gemmatimonadales bacterium]NIR02998.1 hypothetical protein [Gemmatimonadales bacterium]
MRRILRVIVVAVTLQLLAAVNPRPTEAAAATGLCEATCVAGFVACGLLGWGGYCVPAFEGCLKGCEIAKSFPR